jgi:hypothetical protein
LAFGDQGRSKRPILMVQESALVSLIATNSRALEEHVSLSTAAHEQLVQHLISSHSTSTCAGQLRCNTGTLCCSPGGRLDDLNSRRSQSAVSSGGCLHDHEVNCVRFGGRGCHRNVSGRRNDSWNRLCNGQRGPVVGSWRQSCDWLSKHHEEKGTISRINTTRTHDR